jgi:hypothetical protein
MAPKITVVWDDLCPGGGFRIQPGVSTPGTSNKWVRPEYLFSVGFTARRATSAEVSKASRLTLLLQANRSDLRVSAIGRIAAEFLPGSIFSLVSGKNVR